ncbi:MAG: 4Fe-4S binding protein [Nanoarchaeota archaeon]|nr:4Fe-4S binding protein [Nanoarchaeota archaeon]
MAKRKIIKIDREKCDGCGLCIPECPEGALLMIDGKARLVSDLFCDGLGACLGHCPKGAITIEEREAEPYDERKVMENIVKQGKNTIKAHLEHLKEHGETEFLEEAKEYLKEKKIDIPLESKGPEPCGCPGAKMRDLRDTDADVEDSSEEKKSELRQWTVQLHLVPPNAPFFQDADLLIAADCVAFADPNFHKNLLKGKFIAIGCPKLDNIQAYKEKIEAIISMNNLKSITVTIMEVPCCLGLYSMTEQALEESGKKIPLKKIIIGIDGQSKQNRVINGNKLEFKDISHD